MKVDKSLIASVGLHVLVLGWGLISFSSRAYEPKEESIPIDFVTSDQFSKITAGMKSGAKDAPKPLVEKIADATPTEDNIGKITDKNPVITDAGSDLPPKPVEKKPDPPKPVAESKPKDEAKQVEKQPDQAKVDPIAEALKKQDKKSPPKHAAKSEPIPPTKKHEYKFDSETIAALVDKRDPSRQAITGAALNSSASLGSTRGTAVTLSQNEMDAMTARLASLWNVQPGIDHPEEMFVTVRIRLTPDRRLAAPPEVVSTGSSPRYQAAAEAAKRAVLEGQPYTMLRDQTYDAWKYMDIDFDPKKMFPNS